MPSLNHNQNGAFSESELRAVERSVFGGRRVLWAGVLAVLLPLALLLFLQYWWLTDLERNSAIAREATLKNYLEAITKDVHYFYWKISERALNLPPEVFGEKKMGKAAAYFKKKEIPGAKRLFVVSFLARKEPLLFYEPRIDKMVVPEHSDETVAVWAAASPWAYLRKKGAKLETTSLSSDQHDPSNRIIINPITDEESKLVGLAGMIIDQDVFVGEVLPKAIEASLPKFDDKQKTELLVVVRDNLKRQILPVGEKAHPKKDHVSRAFDFIFTDWRVSLQGDFASAEKWARANFAYNITLSAVLAAVLLGGIALTVRTAMREMKLSAMKNEFVSNVSHELRTPLSSIRVFGEFMRRGRVEDQEKVREYGSYIETESRRLTQLINNILDFSRIESGRKVYNLEDADLEEILAGTLGTFTVRLRDRGFDVSYHGPDEPLPEVQVDPNAIDRAVANLLDNAVKYSNDDRSIEVTLGRTNGEAVISVSDHGIGIPRGEQERIFERFHRVSTGLVHDVKGSGLGLSLVRHIAEAHGGRVTVESEVGKGSTFTIYLPLERPEGEGE
ncbi:MAG: HAMP domain-containing histidine kinase [Acidobacteria bacterium]|nr:HAMP domain-containing histidine kinase [Acidobacteriota bacterium]